MNLSMRLCLLSVRVTVSVVVLVSMTVRVSVAMSMVVPMIIIVIMIAVGTMLVLMSVVMIMIVIMVVIAVRAVFMSSSMTVTVTMAMPMSMSVSVSVTVSVSVIFVVVVAARSMLVRTEDLHRSSRQMLSCRPESMELLSHLLSLETLLVVGIDGEGLVAISDGRIDHAQLTAGFSPLQANLGSVAVINQQILVTNRSKLDGERVPERE
jgi:hypothetical protein